MNRTSRVAWLSSSLALSLLFSGCATPTLLSKPKASTAKRSSSSSSSSKKSGKPAGLPAADEIPDAHAVGLGVKGG